MMPNLPSVHESPAEIDRPRILELLKSGIESNSFQFVRQVVMAWLAAYPDLAVNLVFVQAMIKEGKDSAALPLLEKIIRSDPDTWTRCKQLKPLQPDEQSQSKSGCGDDRGFGQHT